MVLVKDGRARLVSPRDAGVRSGFYNEPSPEGTRNVLDPGMAPLEDKAIQIIRTARERWPLCPDDRVLLAEFIGLQLVRGPAWRDRLDEYIESGLAEQASIDAGRPRSEASASAAALREPAQRNRALLDHVRVAGSLFNNMHWTLLVAERPLLFTSDHPVVPVPLAPASRALPTALPMGGLTQSMEFRFALTPTMLLVLSWLDAHEGAESHPLRRHHARNHNALVTAQADKQWFTHPDGPSLPPSPGSWTPISVEIHAGYDYAAADRSYRRHHVSELLEREIATGRRVRRIARVHWTSLGSTRQRELAK
jgi:hypothetical protein